MSYQVLARKWRPRTFHEMVGQKHVQQALVNALEHNRLHHAYLFTGTRGVGKTSIARILAKCLNCETGITSKPCGTCASCTEIAEGRFVDLIEVDAASRTKVEDTRELLENVQYAPSKGRFKVYLIDEVHMLTTHSFNALLKTLEEPPEHVKFLLATTDPQKLPVTILSRCLQFNLKNMTPEEIVMHLQDILGKEDIPFEEKALWLLGKAANGSMRDALSLTDQAIAYGAQSVAYADVASMLGAVEDTYIIDLINALSAHDGKSVLAHIEKMASFSIDFKQSLDALMAYLHRLCIAQTVPDAVDNSEGDRAQIIEQASQLAGEEVQLFYQVAVSGKKEFDYVPSAKMAFEMILLRMLAFAPKRVMVPTQQAGTLAAAPSVSQSSETQLSETEVSKPEMLANSSGTEENESAEKKTVISETEAAPVQETQAQETPQNVSQPASLESQSTDAQPIEPQSTSSESTSALDKQTLSEPQQAQQLPEPENVPVEAYSADSNIVEPVEYEVAPQPVSEQAKVQPPSQSQAKEALASLEAIEPSLQSAQKAPAQSPVDNSSRMVDDTESDKPKYYCPEVDKTLPFSNDQWLKCFHQIGLKGMIQSIVANCVVLSVNHDVVEFIVEENHARLLKPDHSQSLAQLLSEFFERPFSVSIKFGDSSPYGMSPKTLDENIKAKRYQIAVEALEGDANIQWLQQYYGAHIDYDSVKNITDDYSAEMLAVT